MNTTNNNNNNGKKVALKRQINLISGIAIIIGTQIGSGIFVSPKGVLATSNSIGLSLVVWVLCGLVSLLGALCYTELGLIITDSGGDLVYILKGISSLNKPIFQHIARILAFLVSWTFTFISKPTSLAALALATSIYILTPIIGKCALPKLIIKLGAAAIMIILCLINAYSVKLANRIMVVFTFAKILALAIIAIGGIVRLFQGYTINFNNSFVDSNTNALTVISGFYSGLWAYDGWNNLNSLTEEIKNPKRNLPLSTFISMILVTILYVTANISYFTVMSKSELLASDAVAIGWSNEVLGHYFKWLLPTAIAMSTFSAAMGSMISGIRSTYVAAREGLTVKILTMVNIHRLTPQPSVILSCILGLLYLIPNDLDELIDSFGFVSWICYGLTTLSLLILRFTNKNREQAFKAPLFIIIIFLIISIILIFLPIIDNPRVQYLFSIGFILLGLVLYVPFVHFKYDLPYFSYFTLFFQNLLEVQIPDKADDD